MKEPQTNILLVEDNLADADFIQEILVEATLCKYEITSAQRLSEAIACLNVEQIDVILLDLSLPDSHGLETLGQVVLAAPSLPVLVLTGSSDRELAVHAVREGAQDYLVKGTFDCDLLVRSISYAIERKQTLEQLRCSEERYHQLAAKLDLQVQERTAQLQKSLEVEAMLKRITDKVRDSLDQHQIIQTAVQELTKVTGVYFTQVSLYDRSNDRFKIFYEAKGQANNLDARTAKYVSETLYVSERAFPSDIKSRPQLYQQLITGECFQFSDLSDRTGEQRETILACPLRDVLTHNKSVHHSQQNPADDSSGQTGHGTILGYLWLRHNCDYVFSDLEVELVQQVASQCAIALRQAQLYQASLIQVKELERLHQLKDDFLSTVCHELRTPMATIKMALDMLERLVPEHYSLSLSSTRSDNHENRDLSRLPTSKNLGKTSGLDAIDTYVNMAQVECDREIKLINDLLDLQRLEAQVDPLDGISIELQTWLPYLAEAFQERIAQCHHRLELDIAPDLPPLVSDPTVLNRIVSEMLNNACKYTPDRPGEVIRISAMSDQTKMYLSVSNSGVEIPQSELSHIFEKFYRIPSTDPWKQGGTGLGLALVEKLVFSLGGEISVQSAQGQTMFTLELPLSSFI